MNAPDEAAPVSSIYSGALRASRQCAAGLEFDRQLDFAHTHVRSSRAATPRARSCKDWFRSSVPNIHLGRRQQ
jgi:hypothetical protein